MRFSEGTLSRLTAASWWPGRKYDAADSYLSLLTSLGYPVHAAAIGFMEEFGGLYIDCKPSRYNPSASTLCFGVKRAVKNWRYHPDKSVLEMGKKLCIVGECWGRNGTVEINDDGSFYVSDMHGLWLAGRSTEDFLERLCMGKDLMESDFHWD